MNVSPYVVEMVESLLEEWEIILMPEDKLDLYLRVEEGLEGFKPRFKHMKIAIVKYALEFGGYKFK